MLTPEHLQQIKEREFNATGTEWITSFSNGKWGIKCDPYTMIALDFRREEDARFAAHARTDIPGLLAEVERLTAENVRLEKEVKVCHRAAEYVSGGLSKYLVADFSDTETESVLSIAIETLHGITDPEVRKQLQLREKEKQPEANRSVDEL